jgi:hypothetical protein
MSFKHYEGKNLFAIYIIIIILPFLFLYWMVPFIAPLSIGNDYQTTAIENQMEIQFSIRNGSFPLYVPGFAGGHSSIALTLGQLFHPMPYIASLMPGYWDGEALQWNTFFRMLTLGLAHLALFLFLRRLNISILFSFLISCVTVYNLRMLDLFRYGASLESYTGFLLLCSSIGLYYINRSRIWGPLSIIATTYLLINSGHPQMMYYGIIGAGLFTLVIPFFISCMLPDRHSTFRNALLFWLKVGSCSVVAVLLSSAYILPFYFDFVATNAERIGRDYQWADSIRDTFMGTLNNFFLPLRSDVHGAFGGSSFIAMALVFPVIRLFKIRIPTILWVVWGIFLITFFHMQGARMPVHKFVWQYFPFASSFRYAGRISIIIPIFIMILLAWTVQAGTYQTKARNPTKSLPPHSLLALTAALIMTVYIAYVILNIFIYSTEWKFSPFSPTAINSVPHLVELLVIVTGIGSLFSLVLYGRFPRSTIIIGILICFLTFIQIIGVLRYGTWITHRSKTPTFSYMMKQKKEKLDYRYYPGTGMFSEVVTRQLKHSFMEPFLGKIYTQVIPVTSMDEAYEEMKQDRNIDQIFVKGYGFDKNISFSPDTIEERGIMTELIYSSFNRLVFKAVTPESAFFSLSYPFTGHWNALLNGKETRIYRANGAAHAVEIPAGESSIEFRYWSPAYFWGMFISCFIIILIGLYLYINSKGLLRFSALLLALVLGISGFFAWYNSIYSGNNLGTDYVWTYKPPPPIPNIAYGKKTWTSSSFRGSPGYMHSSRAVDGDTSPGSGFSTGKEENPAWFLDLNKPTEVKKIVLYESSDNPIVNIRPLRIDFSADGAKWNTVKSISASSNNENLIHIAFQSPRATRFIRITAHGLCILRFDEVEVFRSDKAKL